MAKTTSKLTSRFKELGLGTRRIDNNKLIDKDGHFRVIKKGIGLRGFSLYQWLIDQGWLPFFVFVVVSYLGVNMLFASFYWLIGVENLSGYEEGQLHPFWHCFYFSSQTLTTVGYGHISPIGQWTSLLASFEAMLGLLGFAFATGIMYGRFSKARAKIMFSENLLIAPYRDIKGLKFRIVNSQKSQLIDMEAKVMYSFLITEKGDTKRRYLPLDLEISTINMFPLPWTVVHPIEENSPLLGKTAEDLALEKADFLVILKGFDETFNQYVHQIHDYNYDEVVFDADFKPMFDPAQGAGTVVHLNKLGDWAKVND